MMAETLVQGPPEEQEICVKCGFCCDGTIFGHAHLKPGEKASIPEKLRINIYIENGEEYFPQPCPYFEGKCTIYNQCRAEICGTYRCQLLKDLATGLINNSEALRIVTGAVEMKNSIINEYKRIDGKGEAISFRQLLVKLGKLRKASERNGLVNPEIDLLIARCNIFEALLIKNFHSADDFEKLVMK